MRLDEVSRAQILNMSRRGEKEADGKNRYEKRIHSRVGSNVRNYNSIDMNKLFKKNILDVKIDVQGETDNYVVTVSFGGFLDELHKQVRDNKLDLRYITRALVNCFNSDNVYIRCTCPDSTYRQNYWLSKQDIIYGDKENRPSNITNPDNKLGAGCKHIMLVLSNHRWLLKVASVINNYCHYIEKYYPRLWADVLYPAIYDKEYEEPVQLYIDTSNELDDTQSTLDRSNEEGRVRGRFTSENQPNRTHSSSDDDLKT